MNMNDQCDKGRQEKSLTEEERHQQSMESMRNDMASFSHAISHDFQAPVRRIICLSQIIIEDHSTGIDDVGKRYLGIISSEANRMNAMIKDLLIWSRTSVCQLNKREINLSKMANDIIMEERTKGGAPEIEAIVEDDLIVQADYEMISMAFRELIGNSVKFAREGTVRKIEFGRMTSENTDIFFIKDNGVGFDQTHSKRLFIPFQRLHGEEFPGEGMGLAITSLIIKRHGGRIWVESIPDQGSTFFFVLNGDEK